MFATEAVVSSFCINIYTGKHKSVHLLFLSVCSFKSCCVPLHAINAALNDHLSPSRKLGCLFFCRFVNWTFCQLLSLGKSWLLPPKENNFSPITFLFHSSFSLQVHFSWTLLFSYLKLERDSGEVPLLVAIVFIFGLFVCCSNCIWQCAKQARVVEAWGCCGCLGL